MKPPGSSSRRPPLTGCSLPGASCGPGRCPAGPVPARAPPCRLLLVLLLLPALAASSRPRARGAAAPSGGYGRCPLRCLLPRGPGEEREGHAGACTPDKRVPSLAFERLPIDLSTLVGPKPRFMLVHFWKSVSVAFTKDPFQ